MKVYLDTNVVLDHLQKREPYSGIAKSLIDLCEMDSRIEMCISPITITDIVYIAKLGARANDTLRAIKSLFTILSVTSTTIERAILLEWNDFEDALQFSIAKENDSDYFVTRNIKDFTADNESPRIVTPTEMVEILGGM